MKLASQTTKTESNSRAMSMSAKCDMVLDAFNAKVINSSELRWIMERVLADSRLTKDQIVRLIAGTEACQACGR